MRKSITINPTTRVVKLPKELVEDGFAGELDTYPNAVTFTLVRPGASLKDVEASLERTLGDIRQRMRAGMDRVSTTKPAPTPKLIKKRKKEVNFDELRQNIRGGRQ